MRRLAQSALTVSLAAALLVGCAGGSGTPLSPSAAGPSTTLRMISAGQTYKLPTYQVLYSFEGGSKDGAFPDAALTNVNGTLYGTTASGGHGCRCGTVYSISASGGETVLYSFKGGSADGASPVAALLNVNGKLYGTTDDGGTYGEGTVFAITTSGKETVLHSFKGAPADGEHPKGSLLNVNSTLYGTTVDGGTYGEGTVFAITTSGKETVLYSFKDVTTDGQNPYAGLINVNGKMYGTTNWGGTNCQSGLACGTVFSITRSGKETLLYSFKGAADGQNPQAALIYVKSKLYGTVTGLGAYCRCGTVFAVTLSGMETVLHSFNYATGDGDVPEAALLDMRGKLYGTTEYGGTGSYSDGTVFEISTSGKERVLHSFNGYPDGANPFASLINVKGTLYGTTSGGGSVYCPSSAYFGCGVVFSLKP